LGVNVVVVEVIERKVDVVVGSVKVLVASAICPSPPEVASQWQVVGAAKASVMPFAMSYAAKIICPCE
jgi:hypothetical protein